jgi:formamidopyrimidine-DNA glycosylase
MPELPEVETYVRALTTQLQGRRIVNAQIFWPRIVAEPDPSTFCELIRGRRFDTFGRRGKYMLFGLDSGETLIIHLRMTGELRVQPAGAERDKHTHLLLDLEGGESIHYRDQRKFGRVWLVEDVEMVIGKLGPEPLSEEFSTHHLADALAGRTASIKALLLDQSIVAGVGNIYADEALYRARIDPGRSGGLLDESELARLHEAVRWVLQMGIELGGSSLGSGPQNYLPPTGIPGAAQESHQVFRRTGQPCPTCGHPIQRIVIAQRSTHFCPQCQR